MITIEVYDEIKVKVHGLSKGERQWIHEKTKNYVKGYHQTSAFKTGKWDGKRSYFGLDGTTFLYLLENKVVDLLDQLGYHPDDFHIIDHRPDCGLDQLEKVDRNYLVSETGNELFDYQVEAINQVIENRQGILDIITAGGKTLICAGIVKAFDDFLPTLTVVPSMSLVNQTANDYEKCVDNVIRVGEKVSTKEKSQIFQSRQPGTHIVCTWQTLNNYKEEISGFTGVLLFDEVHVFGDAISEMVSQYLNHCPIRVGLTGSVPKDKEKREKIFCHIGNDRLVQVTLKEVYEKDIVSDSKIHQVITHNKGIRDVSNQSKQWDWDKEFDFYTKNEARLELIAEYLQGLDIKNTIVFCHAAQARNLSKIMGLPYVDKDMKYKDREHYYEMFGERDDYILLASYGTSATGLDINRIFRLVILDVGKDLTKIVQSIGRGLRKDGEYNKIDIIDISSDTYYGNRHRNERIKIYNQGNYDYVKDPEYLEFGTVIDHQKVMGGNDT